MGSVVFLSTLRSSYRGADTLVNMARYREVMGAAENSNELIASLRNTGELPSNYVTKSEAQAQGWDHGRALVNHIPNGQIGGDVYRNTNDLLPHSSGRVWYEADVGMTNEMKRSKQPGTRLLYSDDGLLYVTADHYSTAHYIGRYK
ncbi:ribonuclease [Nocardiopsis sp. NRRL B-16309]|nr:ribonuclease [Nocardiopsis sp. NRRL B-16309]